MKNKNDLLRKLPKIDQLLLNNSIQKESLMLGEQTVVEICRNVVDEAKNRALKNDVEPNEAEIVQAVLSKCKNAASNILGRVINGTGVLLHTNLGRAPLGKHLFENIGELTGGYCNLEINVRNRKRGIRGPHVLKQLCQLCGSEDAIVVNNNAAALFLLLSEFAHGKKTVVSRQELVQIGGGFRIPDILKSSGTSLVETGTVNICELDDYKNCLDDDTAIILKVHHSNFHMSGFVKSPGLKELSTLKNPNLLLVSDLGSGNMVSFFGDNRVAEPTPKDHIAAGADLVTFSCDKMLGGVQGGVIAGRADLIARLKKNPVMRVVRADKITYAALQTILQFYLSRTPQKTLLWSMYSSTREQLEGRIEKFIKNNKLDTQIFKAVDSESTFGGGSTPGDTIESKALCVKTDASADNIAKFFQRENPPTVGTINNERFLIDFKTVLLEDEKALAESCARLKT